MTVMVGGCCHDGLGMGLPHHQDCGCCKCYSASSDRYPSYAYVYIQSRNYIISSNAYIVWHIV